VAFRNAIESCHILSCFKGTFTTILTIYTLLSTEIQGMFFYNISNMTVFATNASTAL